MVSLSIMVVDDSNLTVKKIKSYVESLGHQVVATCKTGQEAVEDFSKYQPDLITMDITMPDMDGIEATKRILAISPDALILMITSHGQEAMVLDAIKSGAKGYILKPIDKEILESNLNLMIEKYV